MLYKIFVLVCVIIILLLGFQKALADDNQIGLQGANKPVVDSSLFKRIGSCESTGTPNGEWNPHAKNKHSSASGTFQWISDSWYKYGLEYWGEDFYSKNIWSDDNVELARYIFNKYGTKDWLASKSCWSRVVPNDS